MVATGFSEGRMLTVHLRHAEAVFCGGRLRRHHPTQSTSGTKKPYFSIHSYQETGRVLGLKGSFSSILTRDVRA